MNHDDLCFQFVDAIIALRGFPNSLAYGSLRLSEHKPPPLAFYIPIDYSSRLNLDRAEL
jgi:hypothetical protein